MSYVRIWVHLVFSTKNRDAFFSSETRNQVQQHILENCKKKNIFLKAINGYTEHLHCLISLGKEQTIANVTQLIKGESSYWINQNHLIRYNFSWQDDYFAVSVSESLLGKVVDYVKNQELHHRYKPFSKEVEEFMNKFGFALIKDNQ